MITQTLTASQLRNWLADHGVRDANQRIRATSAARSDRGFTTLHNGLRYTVRRLVVGERVYYTIDRRPLRALIE